MQLQTDQISKDHQIVKEEDEIDQNVKIKVKC